MFFGKNKVMMVALGRSPADEYKDNLHQVSLWPSPGGAKAAFSPAALMTRIPAGRLRNAPSGLKLWLPLTSIQL